MKNHTIDMKELTLKANRAARRDMLCNDARFTERVVENKKRKEQLKKWDGKY